MMVGDRLCGLAVLELIASLSSRNGPFCFAELENQQQNQSSNKQLSFLLSKTKGQPFTA
jgi:hypothetical protein